MRASFASDKPLHVTKVTSVSFSKFEENIFKLFAFCQPFNNIIQIMAHFDWIHSFVINEFLKT